MVLIRQGKAENSSPLVQLADTEALPPAGLVLVSSARWLREATTLAARGSVGVVLRPQDDVLTLQGGLEGLSLIAVAFPTFTDGRGYSTARLLRDRLGYTGELRAVGNILPDQLFYLQRVGFDAFELQEGKSVDTALALLEGFSVRYQAAADDTRPLDKRVTRPS